MIFRMFQRNTGTKFQTVSIFLRFIWKIFILLLMAHQSVKFSWFWPNSKVDECKENLIWLLLLLREETKYFNILFCFMFKEAFIYNRGWYLVYYISWRIKCPFSCFHALHYRADNDKIDFFVPVMSNCSKTDQWQSSIDLCQAVPCKWWEMM